MATQAPPTERLYYADPLRAEFTARVLAHTQWEGQAAVVLDRTAFHPEAGGQRADRGVLGTAQVVDVQVDAEGVIHHVIEGAPPGHGADVTGRLDLPRRRAHMALHTGQHMLSRALLDEAGAVTVSSRLGERGCTLDVSVPHLDTSSLRAAEHAVNTVIDEDVAVRAFFPSPDELGQLALRKPSQVTERIRVVCVGDYDAVPCGGTHCTRTSQVGLLTILGAEHYKGLTRVTFLAGSRARAALRERLDALDILAETFTCHPTAVVAAVDKLGRERTHAVEALVAVRRRYAAATAKSLLADTSAIHRGVVVAVFTDTDGDPTPEFLRAVGKEIVSRSDRAAALAADTPEGVQVFLARGKDHPLDCGGLLRAVAEAAGGRGGGRPDHAEGRLPPGTDWPALVSEYLGS